MPSHGNVNKSKTSQRDGLPCHRRDTKTHQNILEPIDGKCIINRSRYGRQMADDAEPIGVLNPDVKATLFNVNAAKVREYTFRLVHEKLSPKMRKAIEHNLNVFKMRCERYSRLSTDARERLREGMPKA